MPEYLIILIKKNLAQIPVGVVFTLAQLVGDEEWEDVRRKRYTGVMFKRLVLAKKIPGLSFYRKRSDGNMLYQRVY